MYKVILLALCILLFESSNANFTHEAATASNQFSLDFLKRVFQSKTGNALVSPVSVYTLLAILQQGAGGTTRQEVTNVVHAEPDVTKESYRSLTTHYKTTSRGTEIRFATRAFGGSNFQLKQDFKQSLINDFNSDIDSVDFSVPANATAHINSWVSESTEHKIPKLFQQGDLSPSTVLVLVNAIYFKSFWQNEPTSTPSKSFSPRSGLEKQVPTLEQTEVYTAGECSHIGAKFVHLDFKRTGNFTFLLILPTERYGLDNLVNRLSAENLTHIFSHTEKRRVNLQLPKFQIDTDGDLIPILHSLGLHQVFQSDADLSGISDQAIALSKAVQKAKIEVNEHGVTAVAATGILFVGYSFIEYQGIQDMDFIADHPFLFFIVDRTNHVPLFAGRVIDPSV